MCKIVYDITAAVSLLCFKGYGNLSNANNRGFSTFHAIVVAFLLLLSDLFKEDYHDELIINRTSSVSETIFRKQPSNYEVYIPRLLAEGSSKRRSRFNLERLIPSPGWVRRAWKLSEEDLLSSSGLDAVVFMRIITFW